jgi:pyruvate/2-oxoglutarate dehydrogenase complex dihydrolipoamide dehydrogenase (E3) component
VDKYDAVIIGAGQAGVPLAGDLARAGWRVALVEREHVGGTCYNEGCTPSKTMAASARVAYLARRAGEYGIKAGPVEVDLAAVRQRKRDLVADWRDGMEKRLRDTPGLDLVWGEARFVSPTELVVGPALVHPRVGDSRRGGRDSSDGPGRGASAGRREPAPGDLRRLQAGRVFVNTGDRPAIPDITGLSTTPFLDSTSVMELGRVPEHLIILGAGYVALEFAQMFRRFGAAVTVVQRSGQVLSREDEDVAAAMAEMLREDGITILFDARVDRVESRTSGITVHLADGRERIIAGSHLLVATGRRPNTEALDLGAAGLQVDERGYIPVNERLETAVPGIWALGDVKGGPAFTHISYDDYRIVAANLLGGGGRSVADRLVPYTVFTDPQLGRVGLTETEARSRGLEVRVATLRMDQVARALETAEPRGFIKAVIDAKTGSVLGAAVLGVDGGELMAQLEIAMLGGVTAGRLHDAVFAHPTLAEALNNLFA